MQNLWEKNSEISSLCSFHLNDLVLQEGQWVWQSSGVPFTYTKWGWDQPNGGGYEDCLYIQKMDKKWNDFKCDNTSYNKPLCQIDA